MAAGLLLKVKPVTAFIGRNWELVLLGLIGIVTALLVTSLVIQKAHLETKLQESITEHERTKTAHLQAVADAEKYRADWERAEREKETANRQWTEVQNERDRQKDTEYRAGVAALTAKYGTSRKQLLDHIGRLTNYAIASPASGQSTAACSDLRERLTATGPLLDRADEMAEGCAGDYYKARFAHESCVAYADKVKPRAVLTIN